MKARKLVAMFGSVSVAVFSITIDTGITCTHVVASAIADVTGEDTGDTAPVSDHAELKALEDKLQAVCDDPANQWIKKLKYVTRIVPAADCNPQDSNDCWPAISVQVDVESHLDEVQREIPPTLGGYPTKVGADLVILPPGSSDLYKDPNPDRGPDRNLK